MIIVTGGAGFIGSNIIKHLNELGVNDIIIVDNLGSSEKWKNLIDLKYQSFIHKSKFLDYLESLESKDVELIIHMGACSITTETNADYVMENNFIYSKRIYDWCTKNNSRMIYASSAAVYGSGDLGYDDTKTDEYLPMSIYGYSKKVFDQYVNNQTKKGIKPAQIIGLRFFNVYGPREYHKGFMASVVLHSYKQIKTEGYFEVFRPHITGITRKRDYVYVKDCCKVIKHFIDHKNLSGIYNVGTGEAGSFEDFAKEVFNVLKLEPNLKYIEMPESLKKNFQYFTQADISKLRHSGYKDKFYTVEEGISDYINNYLIKNTKLL